MQEADFHEVADEFIHLANELAEDWATPFLSAAILYAAARYNAHFFFENDGDPANVAAALDHYTDQYKRMLAECIKEMAPN